MKRNCEDCIWYEDCLKSGLTKSKACSDYYNETDENTYNEEYYVNDLKRREKTYREVIREYE